ncbi:hypothetical protein BOX15_Mlig020604g2, partial [Macrostomum lignano]
YQMTDEPFERQAAESRPRPRNLSVASASSSASSAATSGQEALRRCLQRAGLSDCAGLFPAEFSLSQFRQLTADRLRIELGVTDQRLRSRILCAVRRARCADESDREVRWAGLGRCARRGTRFCLWGCCFVSASALSVCLSVCLSVRLSYLFVCLSNDFLVCLFAC